jgi:uncharacterized protein with HEPN domain
MARMRDKVIHHYRVIDAEQVWNVATRDVPELVKYLLPLLPPTTDGRS